MQTAPIVAADIVPITASESECDFDSLAIIHIRHFLSIGINLLLRHLAVMPWLSCYPMASHASETLCYALTPNLAVGVLTLRYSQKLVLAEWLFWLLKDYTL